MNRTLAKHHAEVNIARFERRYILDGNPATGIFEELH